MEIYFIRSYINKVATFDVYTAFAHHFQAFSHYAWYTGTFANDIGSKSMCRLSYQINSFFCRGIQHVAPVDSFVTPEPWQMPGYDCPVVMAAGSFIQGSSIELSCDGPMREPYLAYLQGGLTYESGKLGIMLAIGEMLD